ncbi:hypothetical protein ACFQL0_19590 [Haloplanus litoreus]|uniref:hypothetical protein n=1 Tax=Haloplanus litoreus TaxID=767515 RepID=UPI003615B20E
MNTSDSTIETMLATSGLTAWRTNCGIWNSSITSTGTNSIGLRWRALGVWRRAFRTAMVSVHLVI